ncbi:MAG: sigma-54 dependent transcriptional regulator [Bacteroidetes bacterium]|nr:sigma-54 dependent transcriptional regulator [Bacteroidota bacterium]MCL5034936.1 sigma-54 dependent transcriptional regulator [Bacteroidota bacterium]
MKANVLLVDDEQNILRTMKICLESIGLEVTAISKPDEALGIAAQTQFDIGFFDLKMHPIDGLQLLAEVKKFSPDIVAVIVTAHGSVDSAVQAIKQGAYDYLQKPFDFQELQHFAQKVYDHYALQKQLKDLQQQLHQYQAAENIITTDPQMLSLLNLAREIADTNISVLIEGESGTGKELLAKFIHKSSSRTDAPFTTVNCAALSESLLESELFGHIRGSFTGAVRDRQGRFEIADGGTVFLDEITEIPTTTQAKLLRFLQSREFERVGDSQTIKVDVRFIAATNRDLKEALAGGTFRDDLYYRINGVKLKLPPLRERADDIPLLMKHFVKRFAGENPPEISAESFRLLTEYNWPGNIRQLENVVERAVLLAHGKRIEVFHLPDELQKEESKRLVSLEQLERDYISRVIQETPTVEEASRVLGIDPATLWRKRKKYGL